MLNAVKKAIIFAIKGCHCKKVTKLKTIKIWTQAEVIPMPKK
jgi:hypothetical protein